MAGERTRTLQAWPFCWSNGVQGCHTKLRVWSYLFGFTCDTARCHSSIFFISLIANFGVLFLDEIGSSTPWPNQSEPIDRCTSHQSALAQAAGGWKALGQQLSATKLGGWYRSWQQKMATATTVAVPQRIPKACQWENWKGSGECTLAVLEHLKQEDVSSRFHDDFS